MFGKGMNQTEKTRLRTKCSKCNANIEVPLDAILDELRQNNGFRAKVAILLSQLSGGKTKLDAVGRRQRALNAVQARDAKRSNRRV